MKESQTILITGASSGLGKHLALTYATEGTTLLLHGRDKTRLHEVATQCSEKGAQVVEGIFDVTDRDATAQWITAQDTKTPIDIVIANAGISGGTGGGMMSGETPEQSHNIFAVNVNGVLNTIHPLIPRMQSRKSGQIAVMSSLAGFRGLPGAPSYSASKVAVRSYGEALRVYLKKEGIRVNVICPGFIKTPMTDANNFSMPMLMTPEKAAAKIKKGLAKNKGRIAFPFLMYFGIWLLSCLSPTVSDPILERLPEKN